MKLSMLVVVTAVLYALFFYVFPVVAVWISPEEVTVQ